ncbi:formate dehydrogenase subunit gamma [Porticoccus sp. GXU_MW_L64]
MPEPAVPEQAIVSLGDVQDIIDNLKSKPGALLPILHAVQGRYGYIPKAAVAVIADSLNLSRAEVHGVISFYHFFRSEQGGEHTLYVCRAEACQSMGSRQLEAYIKEKLAVEYHGTSADGKVTLEPVYCLGNCACSPNVRLDDSVYARMDQSKVDKLLSEVMP